MRTVSSSNAPSPASRPLRELFKFSDGGQAYLDWCGEDRSSVKTVVVVLPGITGEDSVVMDVRLQISRSLIHFGYAEFQVCNFK